MLLRPTLHATVDVFFVAIFVQVIPFQHEEFLSVSDDLRVDGIVSTSAERQIIDGVQEIRLSLTVLSDEAVHLGRQAEVGRLDVLVIDDGNVLENQSFSL